MDMGRNHAVAVLIGLATVVVAQVPAAAAAPTKSAVLSDWTQPDGGSYNRWNDARQHQGDWAGYGFDWSTDYCTSSPDNPLGFDSKLSCYRHDFGYRNYQAMGQFGANKARLDDALYQDLRRKCATYSAAVRPACDSLAWTYYQAVKRLGVTAVSQQDLDDAARLKERGERAAAAGAR
jgi:hypothetical protein